MPSGRLGRQQRGAGLLRSSLLRSPGLQWHSPSGIGLSLVVGVISSYIFPPSGNPLLLFGGIALVAAAAIDFDALAYRQTDNWRNQ